VTAEATTDPGSQLGTPVDHRDDRHAPSPSDSAVSRQIRGR
jgi:hypothetical protein